MKHGSLFSGIGGFDLAAQWMGWENVFHCEIAEFPRKVLHHYWPNAISYENIIETDFTKHRGHIDVISGGFPCQPYSLAGKRLGKEDARHLWPEMLRTIREIQPRWVVGENVFGLVNWNGGLVFNEVQSDLEAEGYEVQAYVLPACAVNAPHRRDRVWFVAHAHRDGGRCLCGQQSEKSFETHAEYCDTCSKRIAPDTEHEGLQGQCKQREGCAVHWEDKGVFAGSKNKLNSSGNWPVPHAPRYTTRSGWDYFPTQSPVCGRNDGLSSRLDGITFSKWRNESIKAYGNAVVPQVVFQIFKAIQEYENKY